MTRTRGLQPSTTGAPHSVSTTGIFKPARDLEQNWSIDVASELEAYLNQVEGIQTQESSSLEAAGDVEDEEGRQLNFVEAALLLQNSTSVYSKKVEYLRALTYETLNHFATTTRGPGGGSGDTIGGASSRGRRKNGFRNEEWDIGDSFFVPWNAVRPPGGNVSRSGKDVSDAGIYLPPDPVALIVEPGDALKVLRRSATYLSKTASRATTQTTMKGAGGLPVLLAPRDDRSDFKLFSLSMDPRIGALLVDPQDALSGILHENDICHDSNGAGLGASGTPYNNGRYGVTPQHTTPEPMAHSSGAVGSTSFAPGSVSGALGYGKEDALEMSTCSLKTTELERTPFESRASFEGAGLATPALGDTEMSKTDVRINTTACPSSVGHSKKLPRLAHNPLQPLDCHTQIGRDRPRKIGKTFKAPDTSIYLNSAEDLTVAQLDAFLTIQQSSFTSAQWCFSPPGEKDCLDCSSSVSPASAIVSEERGQEPRLVGFPDLKPPALPLCSTFKMGPLWSSIERVFITTQRAREIANGRASSTISGGQLRAGETASRFSSESLRHADALVVAEDPNIMDTAIFEVNAETTDNNEVKNFGSSEVLGNTEDTDAIEMALMEAHLSHPTTADPEAMAFTSGDPSAQSGGQSLAAWDADSVERYSYEQAQLYHRISNWRSMVDKWLAVVSKRGPFDVAEYQKDLADRFSRVAEHPSKGTFNAHGPMELSFRNAVSGASRASICRYFLTTLVMCNEQMVTLTGTKDDTVKGLAPARDISITVQPGTLERLKQGISQAHNLPKSL